MCICVIFLKENCYGKLFHFKDIKKSSCINNTFLIKLTMLLKLFHLYPYDPMQRLNLSLAIQVSMQELNKNRTLNLELWSLYILVVSSIRTQLNSKNILTKLLSAILPLANYTSFQTQKWFIFGNIQFS